ncbi:hypothetical protein C5Y97_09075 [Blastopirellula marina]|uniref:Uncharacterized protein n=2 Tax=Blastopirellula marina TaxID=124 RepID=A0A2S8G1R3_9BACT|nr:hypothetical protein C5Y98_09070 [Blastopirellula marina]PTL44867.1 hypothetical protein C5Y97_09075 [Blastopirellula marina]
MIGAFPLLVAPVMADGPKMLVEMALVVRTQDESDEATFEEEISAALQKSDADQQGLARFIERWLSDKERSRFTIDLLSVKSTMGEEVEVTTQRVLSSPTGSEFGDGSIERLRPLGVSVTLQGEENDQGNIDLRFRFDKRTEIEGQDVWKQENGRSIRVPSYRIFGVRPEMTLQPNVPSVLGGLIHGETSDGKRVVRESVLIIRAVPAAKTTKSGS